MWVFTYPKHLETQFSLRFFWYIDDDFVLRAALPALAAAQLGAVQWFSCAKLTSTSPWQYSATKWMSGNMHWIYWHVHMPVKTHILVHRNRCKHTHTLVKVTMLHETKGQMVDKGTVPALARWLKICISVHTCTWMNPYRSLCSRFTAVCQISACFNAGESTSISSVNSLSKAKSWNCWSKSDRPFSICSG